MIQKIHKKINVSHFKFLLSSPSPSEIDPQTSFDFIPFSVVAIKLLYRCAPIKNGLNFLGHNNLTSTSCIVPKVPLQDLRKN